MIIDSRTCFAFSSCSHLRKLATIYATLLESAYLPSASSLPSAGGRQRGTLPSACKKQTAKMPVAISQLFAVCQQMAKNLYHVLADGKEVGLSLFLRVQRKSLTPTSSLCLPSLRTAPTSSLSLLSLSPARLSLSLARAPTAADFGELRRDSTAPSTPT